MAAVALVLEGREPSARACVNRPEDVLRARVRTSSSSGCERSGSSPRTYSSSASTKTQNGRSRSSSEAEPESTICPRRPRARELGEQPRLADPRLADELDRGRAGPQRARRGRPRSDRARRFAQPVARHPEPFPPLPAVEHTPENQGAGSGCRPDVRGGRAAGGLRHALLSSSTTATTRTSAESSSPPSGVTRARSGAPDHRVLPHRRARDLVAGRGDSEADALALLPFFVAARTTATTSVR